MYRRGNRQPQLTHRSGRTLLVLVLLLLFWSLCLGLGFAMAIAPATATDTTGTVDRVPEKYRLGQLLYLENCATCHIGISPAVLPSQSWQELIQDPQHYGSTIIPLQKPKIGILWDYLRTYSRPKLEGEETPYRIYQSRYFKALHPTVKLPTKVGVNTCLSCHPGAGQYDFRSLSSEWQNAP